MHQKKRDMLNALIEDLDILDEAYSYGRNDIKACVKILNKGMPTSKQDFMDEVMEMDKRIRVIDSAVPIGVYSPIQKLGICTDGYVTVYYHAPIGQGMGKVEILDIYSRWAILNNNR